ncbi:O-methyltransferase [Salinimicrobium marinum]|uniref:O-methyltransferase n=1 Tax=Salinimicrobium marinum TaxID=680283 RepID=A0A918S896_9FLAO|nr:class I SAM-dependent methyltransferase [Salinimicrobium marinum]GHA28487.1 O-methyltransferase [Salinimicrobium marinum]
MHLFISYIKFLIKSTNQHGVHSPFVFGLVTKCFYDKKKYPAYEIIKKYRKKLLQNRNSIKVADFGAGSRIFSSNERKIAAIAKNAGITPKRAQLLNRLVRYLEVERALELGTSLGISTAAMAAQNKVQIISIEGCAATAGVARKQFEEFGFKDIEMKVGEFERVISKQYSVNKSSRFQISNSNLQPQTFDLIFIDGNHQKQATLNYFEKLLSAVHNDSVMIFDDIHWSKDMEAAWEEIKLHPEVSVTVDTFQWGLIFFRKEQAKEHFVVRV